MKRWLSKTPLRLQQSQRQGQSLFKWTAKRKIQKEEGPPIKVQIQKKEKKINIAESSFVEDESSEEEHEGEKNSGDQDFVFHQTNLSSLPSERFGQGTSDPKVFHSPGQTHFYSKEEQAVIEQAQYKEIKS